MDCKKFEEGYFEFLYDDLSDEESSAYKEHMNICKECRKIYKDAEKIKLIFNNMEQVEPEEYLMDKIKEKAMNYKRKYPIRLFDFLPRIKLAFSAIFILILIIGVSYIQKDFNINYVHPEYNETGKIIDSNIKNLEYKTSSFSDSDKSFGFEKKDSLWESSCIDQKMDDIEIEVKTLKKNFEEF